MREYLEKNIEINSDILNNEDSDNNRNKCNKLNDIEAIIKHCGFISSSIENIDKSSNVELAAIEKIFSQTRSGKDLINELNIKIIDIVNECNDEIPVQPSCKWISEITKGKHCDNCQLSGVVKEPYKLGSFPWNKDKRYMVLEKDLDKEIIITEAILATHSNLFQQGEHLVRVTGNSLKAAPGSKHVPLEIQPISAANLRERLSREFVFLKIVGDQVNATYAPPPLVSGLLERGKYPNFRKLRGITEVPVLRPDGSILQTPGYDPATELLYQPMREFPVVPDYPKAEEVRAALDDLLDIVVDFPFSNVLGKAVYLAALLTVVCRFAFRGCSPMVLIDANTPGVGKSKLADVIGLVTTGQPLPRSTQGTWTEEEKRQITSILLQGARLLLIDNVGQRLGSPILDALLTSEIWQDRLRGRNTMLTLPNLLLVIATGNNMQLKADTVRRCIRLQLDSRDEHPEARSEFRYPDLEAHVADQQPHLLAAALTLVRGYIAAGRPQQDIVTLGSFEGWSRLVQSAVTWAFGVDPGHARLVADDEVDLDKEILDTLTRGWSKLVPNGTSISCRRLMARALETEEGGRDILEAMEMANSSGKRTPVALGRLLTRFRKRVHRGSYFDHGSPDRTADGRLWRLFSLTT